MSIEVKQADNNFEVFSDGLQVEHGSEGGDGTREGEEAKLFSVVGEV